MIYMLIAFGIFLMAAAIAFINASKENKHA